MKNLLIIEHARTNLTKLRFHYLIDVVNFVQPLRIPGKRKLELFL